MALIYIYGTNNRVVYNEISDDIVLLSPSLYWFKPCSIPTKNQTKAKNIAKHIMSDKPLEFSEIVLYKNGELFDAYAYDKKFVKEQVKRLNLKNPKVYFANQLQLKDSVKIDEKNMLYAFNNRIMESKIGKANVTSSLKSRYTELLHLQKPIKGFSKDGQKNSMFLVASLVLFFVFVSLFSVDKLTLLNKLDKELESVKKNDRSFYEIKSLISRYKKLDKTSKKLKKELKNALKKDGLKSLTYENGSLRVQNVK